MPSAKTHSQYGFTIVETLIVLAVTGVLFVSTVALISGQIGRYQYRDAVFRLETNVRKAINDAQAGVFPSQTGGMPVPGCTSASPGTSSDCEIVGKRIEFGPSSYTINALAKRNGDPLIRSNLRNAGESDVQPYPTGLAFVNSSGASILPTEILILYNTPDRTAPNFIGGSQSVTVYDRNITRTAVKLCFTGDGDRKGTMSIGGLSLGNSVSVALSADHVGCANG